MNNLDVCMCESLPSNRSEKKYFWNLVSEYSDKNFSSVISMQGWRSFRENWKEVYFEVLSEDPVKISRVYNVESRFAKSYTHITFSRQKENLKLLITYLAVLCKYRNRF